MRSFGLAADVAGMRALPHPRGAALHPMRTCFSSVRAEHAPIMSEQEPASRRFGPRLLVTLGLALANIAAPERLLGSIVSGRGFEGAGAVPAIAAVRTESTGRHKKARLALKAKLSKVPVFLVTNEGGSPFLSQRGDGDQAALMFLFPGEANKMLEGILKQSASSGARILTSNLDRAFQLAMKEPSLSGLRDQVSGRELKMVWQFTPHAAEQFAAAQLMIKTMKAPTVPKIPAYITDSLVYTRRGKQVRPIFLAKKDLQAAIDAAVQDGAPPPKVQVVDLLEYLVGLVEGLTEDPRAFEAEINEIELVPPSESVDFKTELKRESSPQVARIIPPSMR
uniref:Uncharacterized protein n=1 Tax=Chrysotila carterae TaxID=13221 RepID=A0A7S4FCC1_CHRCT